MTEVNRKKNKVYYETKINNIKHDGKKLWSILNDIMGRKRNSAPSVIESEGSFITKPRIVLLNCFTLHVFSVLMNLCIRGYH